MKKESILNRRAFIGLSSGVALSAASLPTFGKSTIAQDQQSHNLNFLIDRKHSFVLSNNERGRLEHAVLNFLETHYAGMSLQVWGMPYEQIDFSKRLKNIIFWINKAVKHHESLYPVDPIWVLSQIKAESLFCEFALSPALAAGICQLMPYTARAGHQMIVAGDLPEHHMAPYKKPELANALIHYNTLVKQRRAFIKKNRSANYFDLNTALDYLKTGKKATQEAQKQLDYMAELAVMDSQIKEAREQYVDYIETNIRELGKQDLFGQTDFFLKFDERFTYRKPIFAMVKMLANALRVRNGNVLAAAAAYNAGLSRTWTSQPVYTDYGLIPAYDETSLYVSKVVANYEEIAKRYHLA